MIGQSLFQENPNGLLFQHCRAETRFGKSKTFLSLSDFYMNFSCKHSVFQTCLNLCHTYLEKIFTVQGALLTTYCSARSGRPPTCTNSPKEKSKQSKAKLPYLACCCNQFHSCECTTSQDRTPQASFLPLYLLSVADLFLSFSPFVISSHSSREV